MERMTVVEFVRRFEPYLEGLFLCTADVYSEMDQLGAEAAAQQGVSAEWAPPPPDLPGKVYFHRFPRAIWEIAV